MGHWWRASELHLELLQDGAPVATAIELRESGSPLSLYRRVRDRSFNGSGARSLASVRNVLVATSGDGARRRQYGPFRDAERHQIAVPGLVRWVLAAQSSGFVRA